jgi:hypothetical protein
MALENSQISAVSSVQSPGVKQPMGFGIVYSVILDENHPYLKGSVSKEQIDKQGEAAYMGAVQYRITGQPSTDDASLPIAFPYDKNFKTLPLVNESVEILQNNGVSYYRRIGLEKSPNIDSKKTLISELFPPVQQATDVNKNYKTVQETGTTMTNVNESSKYDKFGEYFQEEPGIHKLKLYEGDSLIETRFGQSVRFSGFNNSEKVFSPTIIIRNNENAESKKQLIKLPTEEDINRDSSVIVLGSNQYQLPFQPGTISDKGSSDFETKPNSFKSFPSKLIGDQILINSGRIIISAKNAEMMFFSKKNYGFISDGAMSIDNKLGIDVNVGDNINVTATDRDINFNTSNGKINLGNTKLEPLVKGDSWVSLMEELIDAIVAQQYLTPSGPSATGPVNAPSFNTIKSKLKSVLSELNKTS